MPLDVVDAVLQVSVPLGQVHLEQVLQEVLKLRREVRREPDLKEEVHGVRLSITHS